MREILHYVGNCREAAFLSINAIFFAESSPSLRKLQEIGAFSETKTLTALSAEKSFFL